jgi:hypothetical protein
MMRIKRINKGINNTLKYLNYCKKSGVIKPPVVLKGIIGELLAAKILNKYFGDKVNYIGGRKKNFDIEVGSLKIQVKTSHHAWDKLKFEDFLDYETSPDSFKHETFKETDFIMWVVIYLNKKGKLTKYNYYIFDSKREEHFFKNTGWFKKDKDRKQIIRIIKIYKRPNRKDSKKIKDIIKNYSGKRYNLLFKNSEGLKGIGKIKDKLSKLEEEE